eukprot:scaffold106275_cov26-Tisochrysis_lutea.AAC.2
MLKVAGSCSKGPPSTAPDAVCVDRRSVCGKMQCVDRWMHRVWINACDGAGFVLMRITALNCKCAMGVVVVLNPLLQGHAL